MVCYKFNQVQQPFKKYQSSFQIHSHWKNKTRKMPTARTKNNGCLWLWKDKQIEGLSTILLSSIEWCIPPILTNHVVCGYWSHWHTGYLLWTSMCLQCNLDQLSAKRSFWHQLCTSTSWTVWIDLLTLNLVNRSFWHQLCSSASLTVWIDSFDTSFAQVPLEPCE